MGWPLIQAIVTNNYVRGGISGLGIVNLIVGVTDLARLCCQVQSRDTARSGIG